MEQNFNRRIETDLDLNGPHLAISSHPSDATVSDGATQTFSVTASATFPGNTVQIMKELLHINGI